MEELTSALNNLTVLLIVIGGSLFTLCLAAGAVLYMTAAGDPHKQQLARGALLSSLIGVVILAMSPIAPRVLSRFVIEPSGGQALDRVGQASLRPDAALVPDYPARGFDCCPCQQHDCPDPSATPQRMLRRDVGSGG